MMHEFRVLTFKSRGFGGSWFHRDTELGRDLEEVLNEQALAGWDVVAAPVTHVSAQVILRRPSAASELVPAAEPEGRGDEPSPAE
jgi:hypothetical protein